MQKYMLKDSAISLFAREKKRKWYKWPLIRNWWHKLWEAIKYNGKLKHTEVEGKELTCEKAYDLLLSE